VLDFQKRARNEIVAGQVAPVLQSGIASFKRGDYSACVRDMEKVLSVDRNNAEAARYLSQADQEISKKDIIAMIERHRVAEESKDLVAVLDHVGSPALLRQWESDYRLIFNGHDGIRSSITVNSIAFTSRTEATAGVSRLLSAVYKKTGIRRPVIEGNRTWRLRKIDAVWKITAES
jgi:hypothetical protein